MAKKTAAPRRRAIRVGETALTLLPPNIEHVEIGTGFSASVNGLNVDDRVRSRVTREHWDETGNRLRVLEKGAQFAIGDWFNWGEEHYGDDVWQTVDASTGWSLKTVQLYAYMAARIAPETRRMDRLGVRHHLAVMGLSPSVQRTWLQRAAADGEEAPWTVARLTAAMAEGEDLPATAYWLLVATADLEDLAALQALLESQGRSCKAVTRRGKAKTE